MHLSWSRSILDAAVCEEPIVVIGPDAIVQASRPAPITGLAAMSASFLLYKMKSCHSE
jgi:hypothetical protein